MSVSKKGFRLGCIIGDTATRDDNGRVVLSFAVGRLLEEIRRRIPDTHVCLPVLPKRQAGMNHVLDFPDNAIVDLPPLRSTFEAQRYYFSTRRALKAFADASDLLLIRLPFQLAPCLLRLRKPKVLQVATNPFEVARVSTDYRGIFKFLARVYGGLSTATMRRLVSEDQTSVISHGQEMWNLLHCEKGRVIVSSTLYEKEMIPRTHFGLGNPPRLLFVGYLRPDKGAHTLLDAFTLLRQKRPIKLTIVGGTDRVTGAEKVMRERIEQSPYKSDIEQKGMMHFGEPLFDLYRSHDVYVLPSLAEGTPRTLIEARSFGCPVVATRVGGVPSSVTHNGDGLLVEPNNSKEMADAISRILDDDTLRMRLIQEGLRRTRSNTLERFADSIVDEIRILHADSGAPNLDASAQIALT